MCIQIIYKVKSTSKPGQHLWSNNVHRLKQQVFYLHSHILLDKSTTYIKSTSNIHQPKLKPCLMILTNKSPYFAKATTVATKTVMHLIHLPLEKSMFIGRRILQTISSPQFIYENLYHKDFILNADTIYPKITETSSLTTNFPKDPSRKRRLKSTNFKQLSKKKICSIKSKCQYFHNQKEMLHKNQYLSLLSTFILLAHFSFPSLNYYN